MLQRYIWRHLETAARKLILNGEIGRKVMYPFVWFVRVVVMPVGAVFHLHFKGTVAWATKWGSAEVVQGLKGFLGFLWKNSILRRFTCDASVRLEKKWAREGTANTWIASVHVT